MPRPSQARTGKHRPPTVAMISLGCPKNEVDTECLLGALVSEGILLAEEPAEADICLVNTCGFIAPAREETLDVLRQLQDLKQHGRLRKVVAMGCMVERTRTWDHDPLARWADERIGFRDYAALPSRCKAWCRDETPAPATAPYFKLLEQPRLRIGAPGSAYLKIAEGCSNACGYCSIPLIRGPRRSRPLRTLLQEAEALIQHGARELNIIAQDVTAYGLDRYGEPRLTHLLRGLLKQSHDAWIRLLYAYPNRMTDELLEILADDPRCCPYIDMPLQHLSGRILKAMRRPMQARTAMQAVQRVRKHLPEGALRTTFLVGFPCETERDVDVIEHAVADGWFDHVGVFTYSPEPGTPAYALGDPIPEEVKEARRARIMEAQQLISTERLRQRIGRVEEVLVEGVAPPGTRGPWAEGRTQREAPGIDGVVHLRGRKARTRQPGERVPARIVETSTYDLIAEPC